MDLELTTVVSDDDKKPEHLREYGYTIAYTFFRTVALHVLFATVTRLLRFSKYIRMAEGQ